MRVSEVVLKKREGTSKAKYLQNLAKKSDLHALLILYYTLLQL